jgi:hypothetical protein
MPKKESSPTDSSPAAASPASLPSARNIRRLDLPLEDVIDVRRKSLDQPQLESTRRKSLDPPQLEDVVVDTRRKSRDPPSIEMVDADNLDDDNSLPVSKEFSSLRSLAKSASTSTSSLSTPTPQTQGPYLTTKDFNYTMTLLDNKINALYKLCRHIGDEQQENSKLISKLVAVDELSDGFWNVSFNIFNFDLISLFNHLK